MHRFHALVAEIDGIVSREGEMMARRAEILAKARAIGRAIDERVRRLVARRNRGPGRARIHVAAGGPSQWVSTYGGGPAESRSTDCP